MKRLLLLMTALLLVLALSAGAAPKYKIGICFDVGGRGDQSFNDSAYNGLVLLAKQFKGFIKDDPSKVSFGQEIELKYLEPKSGGQDRELILRAMAEDGYNLIIGVGFLYSDSLAKVAERLPGHPLRDHRRLDSRPERVQQHHLPGLRRARGLLPDGRHRRPPGQEGHQGRASWAAWTSRLIHKFQGGFIAGAMYVNKDLRKPGMILGQYAGKDPTAFNDPKTGESIAVNFFKQGASIVYHASGGIGRRACSRRPRTWASWPSASTPTRA